MGSTFPLHRRHFWSSSLYIMAANVTISPWLFDERFWRHRWQPRMLPPKGSVRVPLSDYGGSSTSENPWEWEMRFRGRCGLGYVPPSMATHSSCETETFPESSHPSEFLMCLSWNAGNLDRKKVRCEVCADTRGQAGLRPHYSKRRRRCIICHEYRALPDCDPERCYIRSFGGCNDCVGNRIEEFFNLPTVVSLHIVRFLE